MTTPKHGGNTSDTKQEAVLIFRNGTFGIIKVELPVLQDSRFTYITLADGIVLDRKYMSEDGLMIVYQERLNST